MKAISRNTAGFQKVLFDQVDSVRVGGVHVEKANAIAAFPGGVIPAGTALVLDAYGDEAKIMDWENTDGDEGSLDTSKIIGITQEDIKIDDYPLVQVVQAGTCRIDALPDGANRELENVDALKEVLPRITFY